MSWCALRLSCGWGVWNEAEVYFGWEIRLDCKQITIGFDLRMVQTPDGLFLMNISCMNHSTETIACWDTASELSINAAFYFFIRLGTEKLGLLSRSLVPSLFLLRILHGILLIWASRCTVKQINDTRVSTTVMLKRNRVEDASFLPLTTLMVLNNNPSCWFCSRSTNLAHV